MTQRSLNRRAEIRPVNHTPTVQLGAIAAYVIPSTLLTDPLIVNDEGGGIQGRV